MPTFDRGHIEQARRIDSAVADTRLGPVEYAWWGDRGPTVLIIHGTPGGYDHALAFGVPFRAAGFRLLAVSRPGYLGTPITAGTTVAQQADLLGALLDSLGLETVGLLHFSGGGPAGFGLAARHPERIWAQIAAASISGRWRAVPPIAGQRMLFTDIGTSLNRLLLRCVPRLAVRLLLQAEGTFHRKQAGRKADQIAGDPLRMAWLEAVLDVSGSMARRSPGILNDLRRFTRLEPLPLQRIKAPTLVVHGDSDRDVPPSHARLALQHIPNASALWIGEGSHFAFFLAEEAEAAQRQAIEFLRCHAGE